MDTMGEEKTMDFITGRDPALFYFGMWSYLVDGGLNLQLEHRLDLYETGMLPWNIDMTVEESLSDDDDGVPHDVSDSESESENDSD